MRISTKESLERQRLQKENEKLDIELTRIRKPWIRRPSSWLSAVLPALASIFTFIYAIATGFFGLEATKLEIKESRLKDSISLFVDRKRELAHSIDSMENLTIKLLDSLGLLTSLNNSLEDTVDSYRKSNKEMAALTRDQNKKILASINETKEAKDLANSFIDLYYNLFDDFKTIGGKFKDMVLDQKKSIDSLRWITKTNINVEILSDTSMIVRVEFPDRIELQTIRFEIVSYLQINGRLGYDRNKILTKKVNKETLEENFIFRAALPKNGSEKEGVRVILHASNPDLIVEREFIFTSHF